MARRWPEQWRRPAPEPAYDVVIIYAGGHGLSSAHYLAAIGLARIGMPHVRHLIGPLWEMRLGGRDGIARAVYVTATDREVVVVRAFAK